MNAAENIKMPKTVSLFPNSSSEVLRPFNGCGGTFQVIWIEQIDSHGLFFKKNEKVILLATHHNAYSCQILAKRLIEGNKEDILLQLEYIRLCGGTGIAPEFLPE